MTSFMVRVPASSANVGTGFDSMGIAVNLYLTLEVTEQDDWEFISPSVPAGIPAEASPLPAVWAAVQLLSLPGLK